MIVFNIMLDQTQSFENMAPLLADSCRYLSTFCYDIIGFLLTEKWTGAIGMFGNKKKPKVKEDHSVATWLRGKLMQTLNLLLLSSFI